MKFSLLVLPALLLVVCCKKSDPQSPPTPPAGKAETFKISKTTALPLELIVVTLDEPSDKKTLDGRLGVTPVIWQQLDVNTYSFLIPEATAPGTYELKLSGGTQAVSITVTPSPSPPDAVSYTQDFIKVAVSQSAQTQALQDSLVKQNVLSASAVAEGRRIRQQRLEEATAQFNALSEKDKKTCAQFIAANRANLDSLNQLIQEFGMLPALKSGRVQADCPLGIRDEYARCSMRKLIVLAGLTAASAYGLLLSIEAGVAGLVPGAIFLAIYGFSLDSLKDLLLYNLALTVIYLKNIGIDLGIARVAAGEEFKSGLGRVVTMKIPLRNVQEEMDKNSSDPTVKEFVGAVQNLRSLFSGKVGDFLSVKFDFLALKQGFILPESPDKLAVVVLNNTNVKANISNFKSGLFSLVFTTTEKVTQAFDYKLTYQYAGESVETVATGNTLIVDSAPITLAINTSDGVPIRTPGKANVEYTFTVQGNNWTPTTTSLLTWDFGDGSGERQVIGSAVARHSYKAAGTYPITVRLMSENNSAIYYYAKSEARIGEGAPNYYFSLQFGGQTYNFDAEKSFAHLLGGRLDIVGNIGNTIQAGIYFSPANLFAGVGPYKFIHHCDPKSAPQYVLGSHLFNLSTYKTIATTYSLGSVWGCDPSQPEHYQAPGQLIITANDGKVIEGTFEYTDYISKQPVTEGRFKVPLLP